MPIGFTVEQYNTLLAAYSLGALEVEYADKKVRYRSLEEMERILSSMLAQLQPSAVTKSRYGQFRVTSGHFPTLPTPC